MSLKLKIGILLLIMVVLLVGAIFGSYQSAQRQAEIASKAKLGQIMLATSKNLALGELLLRTNLPDKNSVIQQLLDDLFLMRAAVNTGIRGEEQPDILTDLRELQLELPAISILLSDLQVKLAGGNQLSETDLLQLDQLSKIANSVDTLVGEYDVYLTAESKRAEQLSSFYNFLSIAFIIVAILMLALNSYFNVLRPIAILTESAQEISKGNYEHQTHIRSKDEMGQLGDAFDDMTTRLRNLINTLEQQVADRTRALETSTEVSRRLSTILDPDQLVIEVVEQLRSAFGYYHAHIYLFDDRKQHLVMVGGTGDAGRTMLAQGHKIEPGTGLVGRAAKANEILLIPDVLQAEEWLPNPLLPETKAEVAVPIAIGSDVLGVLDVQHNVTDGLTQQDADLIQAIANQVAIAVQNAQDYTRTQKQARRDSQIAEISQRIQSASTIDDVLKVAVSELGQALETQRASVELKVGS